MLQNLMKSVGKMLGTVLFVILLLSFALWGIPNFSREGARAPIATVPEPGVTSASLPATILSLIVALTLRPSAATCACS